MVSFGDVGWIDCEKRSLAFSLSMVLWRKRIWSLRATSLSPVPALGALGEEEEEEGGGGFKCVLLAS
jgi:hypothetical protein